MSADADAVAFLLSMQGAATIHDAHELVANAVKAGASSDQVSQAIGEWMQVQGRQVQQVFAEQRRPDCCTGIHREHPQTADIHDYLRQKGEL